MIRPVHVVAATLGLTATASADTTINFFGDFDYRVQHQGDTTDNSFQASTLDIFASQTEGKFTFVGEAVIEAFGSNEFATDVDRLEVMYQARPWLRLRAGRIRAAFGYYGDAYQNGKFFMVPVSWPEMYEGDGFDGVLPAHAVGVHADVARELGDQDGKLTLDAEVLNGRGIDTDEVPVFKDENNSKAVNLRLRYVGEDALEGFVIGGNVYIDDIPADPRMDTARAAEHELIVAGHAAYTANDVHAVAEVAWLRHREHGTDAVHTTFVAFGEAGYTIGDYTPYARLEYFHFSDVDPFFAASGLPTDAGEEVSAGVKYIASASVSLKAQLGLDADDSRNIYKAIIQGAFAF